MSQFAFDVDAANFQQVVMEGSHATPVVIDFWAPWCGPCKALKPILEKLAEDYQGKFILARIDSDQNPSLAAQFGVKGIPAVKAVVDGQIVDEFSGALPEGAVRAFLDRLVPSPADVLRAQAVALRESGDMEGALATIGQASAWVEPWHASHCRPPWPALNRYRRLALVAKLASNHDFGLPLASTALSSRRPSWWQDWQLGSSSQPARPALPTLVMVLWQLWH